MRHLGKFATDKGVQFKVFDDTTAKSSYARKTPLEAVKAVLNNSSCDSLPDFLALFAEEGMKIVISYEDEDDLKQSHPELFI